MMFNQNDSSVVGFVKFVKFVKFVGAKHSRPDISIPQLNANSECFAQPQNKRKKYNQNRGSFLPLNANSECFAQPQNKRKKYNQ
ncbi:MAG: hypothetical protein RID09_18450, partial [Coleofasciculus sp. G1-WW12-02]|uniref:hypothetical protein n=1 Tax=Coleofasciculus sp. G1-WW12-02 TaxID=3068483 RepID=UPI0032F43285